MNKEKISKELLSLVVGKEVDRIHHIITDHDLLIPETRIIFSTKDEVPILNADTLGRLCEDFCKNLGYDIRPYITSENTIICDVFEIKTQSFLHGVLY